MTMSDHQLAEKLVRRRARVATAFGILFLASQASSLSRPHPVLTHPGPYQLGHVAAWVIWAAILLIVLATGGGLLRTAGVRQMMNDESTRTHRARALSTGFWASLAATFSLYFLNLYQPVTTADALRLVVTIAVAAALISFGAMERRALRDD
jgi:protein-S-isoprenylcysteine O-methyltransferase Ste14